jgi:Calcineurin-like phosphoesterase.
MKIICIGDLHGRSEWREILRKEVDANKIIFLGDYFDSSDPSITPEMCKDNFEILLRLKSNEPSKYHLLLGNYDFQYIDNRSSSFCRRYSASLQEYAYDRLIELVKLGKLNVCYNFEGLLFSHAGVTATWSDTNGIVKENLQDSINLRFLDRLNEFSFTGSDPDGDDISQSPLWIRPKALSEDPISVPYQIVGHTPSKEITSIKAHGTEIWLCDALGQGQYLEIKITEEGKIFTPKNIKS